jgi:hypothetical protein
MDVDQPFSHSKRPAPSSPALSSSRKRQKKLLSGDEQKTFINTMKHNLSFISPFVHFKADDSRWSALLSFVLATLAGALQSTRMKDSFIPTPTLQDAAAIVDKFSEEELEQWKSDVRNGLENYNWYNLIAHRTYFSVYHIVRSHLIRSSDRLRAPSQPETNVEKRGPCRFYQIQSASFLPIVGLATLDSWKADFVGTSANLLELILNDYMQATNPYARYVAHVQSSGTGKSRVHDELAKRFLYIPICLASHLAQGAYLCL